VRRHLRLQWYLVSLCGAFIFIPPLCAFAQKTVVQDAGPGVKQEFDYDAAGRIVEIRTVGTDGKLQGKVNNSYNAKSEVELQTSTSYWPDGKSIQKVSYERFDQNFNFTSEIIEDFDQSGKHVSGHQLFHDPGTGIYRCFDWKSTPQKYQAIDCPESEESHSGPKQASKITREEVLQHLAAARQAAQAEQKSRRMKPKEPVQDAVTTTNKEVGIVFPALLRPGTRVSGSIVDEPDRFAGNPELLVMRVSLPMPSTGDASQLSGWTFEFEGYEPRPGDAPISLVVPTGAVELAFTLRQAGNPTITVSGKVQITATAGKSASVPKAFESAALCFKRDSCVVTGPLSGDSRETFAAFDGVPARIVAETDSMAIIDTPFFMNLGPAALIVAEGTQVQAMPMVVAELALTLNHEALKPPEYMITILRVDGAQELSDDQWHYGVFPAGNVEKARTLVPGFNPAKAVEQDRERREKQEKQDGLAAKDDKKDESAGMVLVIVKNNTPDIVSPRGAKEQNFVFHLTPESFAMGEFKYDIVLDPLQAGTFALKAVAIPFLAPVKAQEFDTEVSKN
jgi:YD repeat-containing protein